MALAFIVVSVWGPASRDPRALGELLADLAADPLALPPHLLGVLARLWRYGLEVEVVQRDAPLEQQREQGVVDRAGRR